MSPHHQIVLGDWARPAHFESGEIIFCEGDPADRFYLIQKGVVALEAYMKGKGDVVIQTVGAGDVLGWSWLFPPCFWQAIDEPVPSDCVPSSSGRRNNVLIVNS